ncbi:carboxypeptidase-like regulatory domain-containing protein [Candidatus Woesearchaeota archaeon]|nr:carboxypeptidase-like regulatory domain-containing protein [Candidatus Woesearchaeota archaeon]
MNKAARYSLVLVVIVLMAMLSFKLALADEGCCYAKATHQCTYSIKGTPQETTETACLVSSNNIWDDDPTCAGIPECEMGCCCQSNQPLYTIRGECDVRKLEWVKTNEEGCNYHCISGIPACKPNCEVNGGECVGVGGKLAAAGKRYCGADGSLYDNWADCLQCMEEASLPECGLDAAITVKCTYDDIIYPPENGGYLCLNGVYVPGDKSACVGDCSTGGTMITADCFCGGVKKSDGYCCVDGMHYPTQAGWKACNDAAGSTCEGVGFVCSDACDTAEDRNAAFDYGSCTDATKCCPTDLPYCCEKEAVSYAYCCDQYEECTGTDLYNEPESDPYRYIYKSCNAGDLSKKPCTAECKRLECSQGNWRINSGANTHPTLTHCYCDGSPRDISFDGGYCCADGGDGKYQTTPCIIETGDVLGYVYNLLDNARIADADINAYRFGTKIGYTVTNNNGEYTLSNMPYGGYKIYASKDGFKANSIDVDLIAPQLQNKNIGLIPYTEGPCDSCSPPAPVITAEPVRGKEGIELSWNIPEDTSFCSSSLTDSFVIEKKEAAKKLAEMRTDQAILIDNDVSWDTTYTYSTTAHYTTNAISTSQDSFPVSPGSAFCEGIYSDDMEFCLSDGFIQADTNNYRYRCDHNNNLVNVYLSSPSSQMGPSCTDEGKDVCVGPDTTGETECIEQPDCREMGDFKPFGLYYDEDSCLDNGDSWCYYDSSTTIIDKCDNCRAKSCYDYKSKEACEADNCRAGGLYIDRETGANNGCKWIHTWEEYGKGICYDPDFNGQECGLCSNEGDLFFNTGCTQTICSALGKCYSSSDGCMECAEGTACEDYENEEACVGIVGNEQEIDFVNNAGCGINNIPLEIQPSNDACGLGVCKWDSTMKSCYKDADDDLVEDCGEGEVICMKDSKPPVTSPEMSIPNIGLSGHHIQFIVPYQGWSYAEKFYYCVDASNTCCPTSEKNLDCVVNTGKCTVIGGVNPVEDLADSEYTSKGPGIYYIRYYSVDNYKNTEEVKSLAFYLDKDPPDYSLTYETEKEGEKEGQAISSLEINLESDECISCSYMMVVPLIGDPVKSGGFVLGEADKVSKLEFSGLEDGIYTCTTNCFDDVGNEMKKDWQIVVDAMQEITQFYPYDKTLKKTQIDFSVNTTDDSTCTATGILGYSGADITFTQEQISRNKFAHTYSGTFGDGTYHLEVDCEPVLGVKKPDSVFLSFTVDAIPPATVVKSGGEVFDFSAWHRTDTEPPLKLSLECDDPDLGDQPGEFGCEHTSEYIKYCLGPSCTLSDDDPSSIPITGDYSTYISYYSVDKGGNIETTQTKLVKVDNGVPQLNLNPPANDVVNTPEITITGTYSDGLSGVKEVVIFIIDYDDVSFKSIKIAPAPSGLLSYNTQLFGGRNIILVSVEDNAGNKIEDSFEVFYDLDAPLIDAEVFNHEGYGIRNKSGGRYAEYGKDITLGAGITDDSSISSAKVTLECNTESSFSRCSSYTKTTFDLEQDPYDAKIFGKVLSGSLPIGNYTATFEAWDNFNQYGKTNLWFLVNDTAKVSFQLRPDAPPVTYSPSLTLTGTASEAGILVSAYLCDENCLNCGDTAASSDYGDATNDPKEGFRDVALVDLVYLDPPKEGETTILWKGSAFDSITRHIGAGDFLRFSDDATGTFYEILSINSAYHPLGFYINTIELRNEIKQNINRGTVSAYDYGTPTGWFELGLALSSGTQCVVVAAERIATGVRAKSIARKITYDTSGFDITLEEPSDGVVNYVDFDAAGNSMPIRIKTERGGSGFRADCVISHTADIIAGGFAGKVMGTTDKITHIFTLNSDSCKENGGDYCLIGGTSAYPVNHHHYAVECTPSDPSYANMASQTTEVCFTAATYGLQTGGLPRGVNICQASTGCGSSVPVACGGAVDCTDTDHSSSQSDCIEEDICKWSGSYGCGTSCHPGFEDNDNDGVCIDASVVCSNNDNDQTNCLAQNACKWCPAGATSNANKCLQESCDTCSGLEHDSNPSDGMCDTGEEGQGGWGD